MMTPMQRDQYLNRVWRRIGLFKLVNETMKNKMCLGVVVVEKGEK